MVIVSCAVGMSTFTVMYILYIATQARYLAHWSRSGCIGCDTRMH